MCCLNYDNQVKCFEAGFGLASTDRHFSFLMVLNQSIIKDGSTTAQPKAQNVVAQNFYVSIYTLGFLRRASRVYTAACSVEAST